MNLSDFKKALSLLKKDEINNLSVIGFIENGYANEVIIKGNSVLAKGISDQTWCYFGSGDENSIEEMLNAECCEEKYFGAVYEQLLPLITKDKKIDWIISAVQLHLPGEQSLRENNFDIHTLTNENVEEIISNSKYKAVLSEDYLKERIERSFSAGIFENHKLAAWGLTHDEGSIGSLNVLKKYRGKGYGTEIVIYLAKRIRAAGRIPFAQVEHANNAALNLFEKLGFVKDKNVSWLKLKDKN